MSDQDSTTITHISGLVLHIGSQLRQRCAWCGYVILDNDLSRMAFSVEPCLTCGAIYNEQTADEPCKLSAKHAFDIPSAPPTWEVGMFIEVTGHGGARIMRSIPKNEVEMLDDNTAKLPDDCCARLPHEMTGVEE